MNISIKDFFSKCDQICRKLRIWSITKEILNGKLHFLCSVINYIFTACLEETRLTTYKKLKNIQANEFSEVVSKFTKNVEINSFSGFISKFGHRFFSFFNSFS